jgi:hypothetical protein
MRDLTLVVSPRGWDSWNGFDACPNESGLDGPLATLNEALRRVRALREQNLLAGTATIKILPGRYALANPLQLTPEDNHVRIVREGEGEVILDGSVEIKDWTVETLRGRECWTASVGHLLAGLEQPRSLFVNDESRPRARFPREGWLVVGDVPDTPRDDFGLLEGAGRFQVASGDFDAAWRNPRDIDAVINHLWVEERMPLASYDAATRMFTSTHRSFFTLRNHAWMDHHPTARYYWDNVFEALEEAGQWYVDRTEGKLYYLPKEGETIGTCSIRLAALTQLARLHGDWRTGRKVENVHFEGITFANTDWLPSQGWGKWWDPLAPPETWPAKDSFRHFEEGNLQSVRLPREKVFASSPQLAHDLPGGISLEAAENCSFSRCTFRGIGFYGIDVRGGCRFIRFERNTITQCGAGGIKIDGSDFRGDPRLRTGNIYVGDCTIRSCGRLHVSAVGVAILHADHNTVEHNEFYDLFYSAISVGWSWGHERTVCQENLIQFNHIHRIGQSRLSDLGGIYLLGLQPGTIVRGNHIHHITAGHYGGSGLYLDEGASYIRVEGNIVHHTQSVGFSDHFVRQLVVMDNIFALCGPHATFFSREEPKGYGGDHPPTGVKFLRNILYIDGEAMYRDVCDTFRSGQIDSDLNLIYNRKSPAHPVIWDCQPYPDIDAPTCRVSLEETRAAGNERNSLVADPLFQDPDNGDFSVPAHSPVHRLGIRLPDPQKAGPRPEGSIPLPKTTGYKKHGAKVQFG